MMSASLPPVERCSATTAAKKRNSSRPSSLPVMRSASSRGMPISTRSAITEKTPLMGGGPSRPMFRIAAETGRPARSMRTHMSSASGNSSMNRFSVRACWNCIRMRGAAMKQTSVSGSANQRGSETATRVTDHIVEPASTATRISWKLGMRAPHSRAMPKPKMRRSRFSIAVTQGGSGALSPGPRRALGPPTIWLTRCSSSRRVRCVITSEATMAPPLASSRTTTSAIVSMASPAAPLAEETLLLEEFLPEPVILQAAQEPRTHARGLERAPQAAVRVLAEVAVREQGGHGDDLFLESGYFRDLGHPAHAIAHALDLDDQVDDAGHQHHVLDPAQSVARRVRVDRRHGAVVPGVNGLQHVEGLGTADLADDDAVGPHAQRVAHKVALVDLAPALDVRRAGLQLDDMRLLQLKLGGVLDRDDTLVVADLARERVQERGLSGSGASGDDDVEPAARADLQRAGDLGRDAAVFDQRAERERGFRELADGDAGPLEAERRRDDVDAAAVEEARVQHRTRFVDAPADRGGDALGHVHDLHGVPEAQRGQLQLAAALDVDAVRAVDQDVRDLIVAEQGLQRTEPHHVVDDLGRERALLPLVQQQALLVRDLGHDLVDAERELLLGHAHGHGRLDARQDLVAYEVGGRSAGGRPARRSGAGCLGRRFRGGREIGRRVATVLAAPEAEGHLPEEPGEQRFAFGDGVH